MLKKLAALVVCSAAAVFSMSASAAVVTGLTTMHTNVGLAGGYTDVNYYNFSTGGGNFSIDVFAVGYGTPSSFDHEIAIFRNDGSLDQADLVALNDDYFSPTPDGSTSGADPYFSLSLASGNYILAISACCGLGTDGVDGQLNFGGPGPYPLSFAFDYQITFSGDVALAAAVPEPGSLALLGLGLVGLAASRKRKQA